MSPLAVTLPLCTLALALSLFFCLERMRRGPTLVDRILAFDTVCVMIVGFMVLLSLSWSSQDYLDMILVFTLLGFFSTIAFCLYLNYNYERHQPGQGRRKRKKERS